MGKPESVNTAARRIATKLQQWRQFVHLVSREKQISEDLRALLDKAEAIEKPEP